MVKASKVKQRRKAFEQSQRNESQQAGRYALANSASQLNADEEGHDSNDKTLEHMYEQQINNNNYNNNDNNKYSKQNYKTRRRLMRLQKAMRFTSVPETESSVNALTNLPNEEKEEEEEESELLLYKQEEIEPNLNEANNINMKENKMKSQPAHLSFTTNLKNNNINNTVDNLVQKRNKQDKLSNNKKQNKLSSKKLNKSEAVRVKQTSQIKRSMKQKMRRHRAQLHNCDQYNSNNDAHMAILNEKGWSHVHAMTRMKAAQRELSLFNEVIEEPTFTQDPYEVMLQHLQASMPTLQPLTEDVGRLPR